MEKKPMENHLSCVNRVWICKAFCAIRSAFFCTEVSFCKKARLAFMNILLKVCLRDKVIQFHVLDYQHLSFLCCPKTWCCFALNGLEDKTNILPCIFQKVTWVAKYFKTISSCVSNLIKSSCTGVKLLRLISEW